MRSIERSSSKSNSSSRDNSSSNDKSSLKSSSSSKLNSLSNDNSLSSGSSSDSVAFLAAGVFFLLSNSLKNASSETCCLRLNKKPNKARINSAGNVPITILNHKLEVMSCSASSASCFSSSSSFSRASAFANKACCNLIISSICNLISLPLATSFCITPSLSLKEVSC